MKKTKLLSTVLAVASLTASSQTAFAEEINQEKLQLLPAPTQTSDVEAAAAITYNSDLTNTPLTHGAGIPGATDKNNIWGDVATWEHYRFCANPGATVTIQVDRTTYDMDPAMQICQGVIADSAGVSPAAAQVHLLTGPMTTTAYPTVSVARGAIPRSPSLLRLARLRTSSPSW